MYVKKNIRFYNKYTTKTTSLTNLIHFLVKNVCLPQAMFWFLSLLMEYIFLTTDQDDHKFELKNHHLHVCFVRPKIEKKQTKKYITKVI